jgi:hypothetical protein
MAASSEASVGTDVRDQRRDSGSMRRVNSSMREVTGAFALPDPIAFFCECASLTCYAVVWMAALDFDAYSNDGQGWLLSPGHAPSSVEPPASAERAVSPQLRSAPPLMPAGRPESTLAIANRG